jgi:glycosyltransferase involved in cell wall biosynthesis
MIAPVFYPYPPVWPEGMVNTKLALAMQRAGWHIDVIIAGHPAAKNRYPSETVGWTELTDHIHVVTLAPHKNVVRKLLDTAGVFLMTGGLLRHLAWPVAVKNVADQLNAVHRYDLILSRAVPDYAHFAALLAHRQTKVPWIANWNDPTPNHKFPPPYGEGPSSSLKPDINRWYQAIGRYAAWHTFPSERLRRYMCGYLPGNIQRQSSVIAHVAMDGFKAPSISNNDVFSLCYAGSVLPPRDATVFLQGVKRVVQRLKIKGRVKVRFMVDEPESVAAIANALGIEDAIAIEPSVPYTQMPEALARSNVLVIIEAPLEEGIFMPSKIVDYVQIGRPILAVAPVVGTLNDLFSVNGGGIAVDCQSPEAVAKAVETLYLKWEAGTLDHDLGSSALLGFFSQEAVLAEYLDVFDKVKKSLRKPHLPA